MKRTRRNEKDATAPSEWSGTKLALIQAAGELFSEKGLKGTSVRAIAEKGGTNVAAVNYHFGSKEKLHVEVMRYVLKQIHLVHPSVYLEDPSWFTGKRRIAALVERLVRERFEAYFAPEQPAWFARFMVCSLATRTRSLETVVREDMLPEHESLKAIFLRIRPALTEEEARLWAFTLSSLVVFYVFSEIPLLMLMEQKSYSPAFLEQAAAHAARALIHALDLD